MEETTKKFGEAIHYERVDIDQNPGLSQLFDIRSVPTTMIFKKNDLKWEHSGVLPSSELSKMVAEDI